MCTSQGSDFRTHWSINLAALAIHAIGTESMGAIFLLEAPENSL